MRVGEVTETRGHPQEAGLARNLQLPVARLSGLYFVLFPAGKACAKRLLLPVEQLEVVRIVEGSLFLQLIEPDHDRRRVSFDIGIHVGGRDESGLPGSWFRWPARASAGERGYHDGGTHQDSCPDHFCSFLNRSSCRSYASANTSPNSRRKVSSASRPRRPKRSVYNSQ